jgi:hypothetical protein
MALKRKNVQEMPRKNDFIARRGRRWFLSVAGGSLGLAYLLQRGVGRAEGAAAPKRLMILHRPDGTIREDWLPRGQRGKILEPFAPVWSYAVALKGMDLKPGNNSNGADPHGKGLTTIMTGAHLSTKTPQGSDDGKWNTAPSLDQVWSRESAVFNGTPVPNLAIGANGVMDNLQEPQNRTLSFAGPEQPLYPVISPYDVYKRVFGDTILPGGDADAKAKALARLRLRRETVLAQVAVDLGRVKQQFPASFRAELEAHEAAIRELEMQLDRVPASGPGCAPPVLQQGLRVNDTNNLKTLQVAQAQFAIVQAAFACDFTRMVTFMWGTGASALSFPEFGIGNHHAASHDANANAALSKADQWFSTHTAPFIEGLMKTPEASGGNLLDNTLVWYMSECSVGLTHDETDMPFVLFGGDGVRLKNRGRVADVAGTTSNDIWLSIAPQFGMPGVTSFETAYTGPIPGLFS